MTLVQLNELCDSRITAIKSRIKLKKLYSLSDYIYVHRELKNIL